MSLIRVIKKSLSNIPGWTTSRKLVIIESDDWGSIRMPSREVYKKCLAAGYGVDKNPYERYDSLLSQNDLEMLFALLTRFRDMNGNHPVFTANCVVANPDFDRIRQNNFQHYYYELIGDTFSRYPNHSNNLRLWHQAMDNKIFFLQYHGREHLNVSLFMKALQDGDPDALFGFANQMPGSISHGNDRRGNFYVESTKYDSLCDKKDKLDIFLEGLDLFEKQFGYKSVSVIPPNYVWSQDYNNAVLEKGVKIFQGIRKMCEPVPGGNNTYHTYYLGKRNPLGQTYLIRNTVFEPALSQFGIKDPVDRCLSEMSIAFRMHKPVVISSHRINYVGFLDETNRDRTLNMLQLILSSALRKWPDIEFMTSAQLGELIIKDSD